MLRGTVLTARTALALQTELRWLLDDAVAALSAPAAAAAAGAASPPGAAVDWRSTTWQQLEKEVGGGGSVEALLGGGGGGAASSSSGQQYLVQLREPLGTLGKRLSGRWECTCFHRQIRGSRCAPMIHTTTPTILRAAEALWEARLHQRIPLQYLTACAFWRDFVLSGACRAACCMLCVLWLPLTGISSTACLPI